MQMKLLAFVSICHGISHETHYTNVVHAIIADLSQTEKVYKKCVQCPKNRQSFSNLMFDFPINEQSSSLFNVQ